MLECSLTFLASRDDMVFEDNITDLSDRLFCKIDGSIESFNCKNCIKS